jgi:hypothetical protein
MVAQATYYGASYLLCSRLTIPIEQTSPVEQATYCGAGYLVWSNLLALVQAI